MKLRRSIAVAIAFACLIPATANASIGKTTVGDWADQPGDGSAGSAQDWRAIASTSETVNRLSVYLLRGTTGKPELGLYDASKTKLASCTISTVVARAWNRCSIPDIGVSAGSTYWLALVRPRRQGVVVFSNRSGSGASYGSLLSNLTAALPTWLDGVFYGRQKASLYADSATPPPPPPDTTPPDTTITSQPSDPTTSTDASFSFSGSDDVAVTGYECQLDDGGYSVCTSPQGYSGLAVGTHTFAVRADDAAGNADPTPASYTWTVSDSSGGGGGGPEPGPIAGQGYHEVFRDDFNALNRSVWDDHVWYDEQANPAWVGFQEADSNGVLHLRTKREWIGDTGVPYPYNTITTQSSGKTFQYGYFEVRMKWPAGHGSWPGFWLYSYQHGIDNNQCTTQAGEIDVMEGQGSEPTNWYGTVHSNTNGCAPEDQQNDNNYQETSTDLSADFHTYAVSWTPTTITWYLDGVETHSAPAYPTDNQPMFLLLQEWTGGWTFDPDATTPDTLDNQIDYVDVWQQ